MGLKRSEFDPIDVSDNVTQPTESITHRRNAIDRASVALDQMEPIDITVDEHDYGKVFGSQTSPALEPELPPRPKTQLSDIKDASAAPAPAPWAAPPTPPPPYEDVSRTATDAQISNGDQATLDGGLHLLLPSALLESGLLFNPQLSLGRVTAVRDAPKDDETSTAATPAAPIDSAFVPSLSQIEACKPHPEAVFVAETLEWRLILEATQLCSNPPPADTLLDATHLFEACNLLPTSINMFETRPISIPAEEQRNPIRLLERVNAGSSDALLPVLEEFNLHRCAFSGKQLLSSPPESIVSVIDRHALVRFKESRENDPAVGLTGLESFVRALRVLLRVIGNFLHGERRGAPTTSASLSQKLGWDQHVRQIFQQLGWKESPMPDGRNAILPPSLATPSTPAPAETGTSTESSSISSTSEANSNVILQRNIRAWIELSIWLAFHEEQLRKDRPASSIVNATEKMPPTRIVVTSASEVVLNLIGDRPQHHDTSYSKNLPAATLEALFVLGASSTTRDELVKFSYLVNLEANAPRATELFACLEEVYSTQRRTSRVLEELVAYERSQGKYTPCDLEKAYERLHLSAAHLGSDVARESIPIDFIVDNYKARAREVLINADASEHAAVKDALKIITSHLGEPARLVQALDEDIDIDVDQAYDMLDANRLDDATILVVFDLYVADAPARREILRHALRAIAEDRKSEYLRHFLRTGERDTSTTEGWQQMPSADLPAGIDNIGNTCYLNSVLQYFFSITEIRSRVLQAAATVEAGAGLPESIGDEPPQGDTGRRVGGQSITFRELQRSRRFVAQLGQLFHHLIHDNALSVRPERELAYLALVSSRAEELEAELNPAPSQPARNEATELAGGPEDPVILSSDPASFEGSLSAGGLVDAQVPVAEGDSMDTSSDEPETTQPTASASAALPAAGHAPPLPPRPVRKSTVADATQAAIPPPARRNSLMQLGAQQDVSECLDNCMFQLEVALAISKDATQSQRPGTEQNMEVDIGEELRSSNAVETNDDAREDLLTNLFLGKTCQRIEADTVTDSSNGSNTHDVSTTEMPMRPAHPHKQPSTHIKHEVFKILPIDVLEEGRDIYDGFDGFFDSDTFVATSGTVQRRSVTLLSAPPLLQIQLQRVQYDRATMRAFKSQAHLEMPETLYVDRYMDLDPSIDENATRIAKRLIYQAKRRRIEELRARLAACKDGASFHLTQTLSQAANAVEELARLPSLADLGGQLKEIQAEGAATAKAVDPLSLSPRFKAKQLATAPESSEASGLLNDPQIAGVKGDASAPPTSDTDLPPAFSTLIDPGLPVLLRDEAVLLREQVQRAKEEIQTLKTEMASIWADEQRFAYRLVAVFMHRGEASHGHYFLNLRGGGEGSKWFKYNDSAVTETSLDQVLRDRSGATPYLVTYVRQDYVQLIDPICRSIEACEPASGMEVDQSTVQKGLAGSESQNAESGGPTQEDMAEPATAVKPLTVNAAIEDAEAESGSGQESPIKRARTDDL